VHHDQSISVMVEPVIFCHAGYSLSLICWVLFTVRQGLVGGMKLAPIAYSLPVGAKDKFLTTYDLLVGGMW
jgi:hypothetical protein